MSNRLRLPLHLQPRFVPTLTQTVDAPQAGTALAALDPADADALLQQLTQRIDALLHKRVRDAVASAMQENSRQLEARLRQELRPLVEQTLREALSQPPS